MLQCYNPNNFFTEDNIIQEQIMDDQQRMSEADKENSGNEFKNIWLGPHRKKLWDLMEKPNSSFAAKILAIVSGIHLKYITIQINRQMAHCFE